MSFPLTEKIETINQQLKDHFGSEVDGSPIWRVVWSEDQYEKRETKFTDEGIELLYPEVRLLPKYKQWIRQKYVLERLCLVPEVNSRELAYQKFSYEPIYVFQDKHNNYLPPKFVMAKFAIDCVYAAQGKKSMAKYVEDTSSDATKARIKELEFELFGNETPVGDALAHKTGVATPHKHFGEK